MRIVTSLRRILGSRAAFLVAGIVVGAALVGLLSVSGKSARSAESAGHASLGPSPRSEAAPHEATSSTRDVSAVTGPGIASLETVNAPAERPAVAEEDAAGGFQPGPDDLTDVHAAGVAASRALRARLEAETRARERLQSEVERLRAALAVLGREVETVAGKQAEYERRARRWRERPEVDPETLVEAGYSEQEAAVLTERWGEQEMAELYLRDQARREGWIGTERYAAAMRDVRLGPGSMRETIGDDQYDAFLFSIGQSNRLLIDSVIESSPAQLAGLREGDVIKAYDGTRIFSWNDLRSAIANGAPDVPVRIEVDRGGEPFELEIPRGPLGVQLDGESVPP